MGITFHRRVHIVTEMVDSDGDRDDATIDIEPAYEYGKIEVRIGNEGRELCRLKIAKGELVELLREVEGWTWNS
jgi:hypothetical protein